VVKAWAPARVLTGAATRRRYPTNRRLRSELSQPEEQNGLVNGPGKLSDTASAVQGKGDARAGAPGAPESGSVWRVPGMPWLLGSAALWFSGFALLAGVAYGGLQNLTLTQAFTAAGEPARSRVSIVWNLSFDAGTGLGAFAAGAIATATSYSIAFAALALATGIVGGCWARSGLARHG
jgi:hypothetical protein